MTSQCLILRKEEILIGSDFAVTTPDGKSYNDGKKIFELGETILFCKIFLENSLQDLSKNIETYKSDSMNQVLESVRYLPTWILCDLADHLIKLTALKQKLSSEVETVSRETHVAGITKIDNFKWLKN